MESVKNVCHDCTKDIIMEGDEVKDGVYLEYQNGDNKINVFKCNSCFEKNKNFCCSFFCYLKFSISFKR